MIHVLSNLTEARQTDKGKTNRPKQNKPISQNSYLHRSLHSNGFTAFSTNNGHHNHHQQIMVHWPTDNKDAAIYVYS